MLVELAPQGLGEILASHDTANVGREGVFGTRRGEAPVLITEAGPNETAESISETIRTLQRGPLHLGGTVLERYGMFANPAYDLVRHNAPCTLGWRGPSRPCDSASFHTKPLLININQRYSPSTKKNQQTARTSIMKNRNQATPTNVNQKEPHQSTTPTSTRTNQHETHIRHLQPTLIKIIKHSTKRIIIQHRASSNNVQQQPTTSITCQQNPSFDNHHPTSIMESHHSLTSIIINQHQELFIMLVKQTSTPTTRIQHTPPSNTIIQTQS